VLQVPEGVDALMLCKNAMDKYSLEIAGGLGPTAGKVWRVGIMVSTQHASPNHCTMHRPLRAVRVAAQPRAA